MRRLRVLKAFLAKQHVYETYKSRARKQGHKKGHTTTTTKRAMPSLAQLLEPRNRHLRELSSSLSIRPRTINIWAPKLLFCPDRNLLLAIISDKFIMK